MKNTCCCTVNKRKISYGGSGCEPEIDFILVGEKYKSTVYKG